ncbi:histidinol-phosphate transaminase [Hanstruepera marina]|uniref:histidinol-phosphate transaminase n=1 Tax=Hanstruepera marina TaxID=2873265 RepID=UPI001CA76686|nr:histidinol-phosphate transaminase [Hanstruepera marina]
MNIELLIRGNVKSLKPYSSARDEFKDISSDLVFLDANENPFDNDMNRYPDPQQFVLKNRLSEIKNIPINNILLGNGSDEILDLIFRVFCEPNQDKVITLPPTYGMYNVLANINAVKNIEIPLRSIDFQPDIDEILRAANKRTKLLFLCSPNNPTANSFNPELVEKLLNQFKGIVIIDEAYIDFSKQESWLSRLDEFPNLIVTHTLSKAYGMAGIRLGICYASKTITDALHKIKPPYNVNELTQQKAIKRLMNSSNVVQEVNYLIEQKAQLVEQLKHIECIEKIFPSDANFILIKVDSAIKRYNQLIKKGIVVRNRTNETNCDNCLRITIGTEKENKKLVKIFNEFK